MAVGLVRRFDAYCSLDLRYRVLALVSVHVVSHEDLPGFDRKSGWGDSLWGLTA